MRPRNQSKPASLCARVLNEPSLLADGEAGGLCNVTSEFQSRKASPGTHREEAGANLHFGAHREEAGANPHPGAQRDAGAAFSFLAIHLKTPHHICAVCPWINICQPVDRIDQKPYANLTKRGGEF